MGEIVRRVSGQGIAAFVHAWERQPLFASQARLPAEVLAEASDAGITVRIAKAAGDKCERCWHYETDIGQHAAHPSLCGRCVTVLS